MWNPFGTRTKTTPEKEDITRALRYGAKRFSQDFAGDIERLANE